MGTISALVASGLALLVAFGIDVDDDQRNAIIGLIPPLFAAIVGASAIIRGVVYSPKTVARLEGEAYAEGASGDPLTLAATPPSGR